MTSEGEAQEQRKRREEEVLEGVAAETESASVIGSRCRRFLLRRPA